MHYTLRTLVLLSATVSVFSIAYAEPPAGGGGGPREACKEDVHSFCSDVKPGGGRIIDCLEDHYKEISDACYSVLKKVQEHRDAQGGKGPPPPPPGGDGNDGPPPPRDNDGPPPPQGGNDDDGHSGRGPSQ